MAAKSYAVTNFGMTWKLTRASYIKLLRLAATGRAYDLDKFGKQVGPTVRIIDMDTEEAKETLNRLLSEK